LLFYQCDLWAWPPNAALNLLLTLTLGLAFITYLLLVEGTLAVLPDDPTGLYYRMLAAQETR